MNGKIVLQLICYVSLASLLYGQNLVPNPSFEDTLACPNSIYSMDQLVSWKRYGGSPDYYHSCASNTHSSAPSNFCGYQNAASGNAYVGIIPWAKMEMTDFYSDLREFVGTSMNSAMVIDQEYYISFKLNYSPNSINSGYAVNKIGIRFSNREFNYIGITPPVNNTAHFYTDEIITDTLQWTVISGSFIADSAYTHMALGNFFENSYIDSVAIDTNIFASYYYVDDVCVSPDPTFCSKYNGIHSNTKASSSIQVFPNPAENLIHIVNDRPDQKRWLKIIDISGKCCYSDQLISKTTELSLSNFKPGLYFLEFRDEHSVFHFQKIVVL